MLHTISSSPSLETLASCICKPYKPSLQTLVQWDSISLGCSFNHLLLAGRYRRGDNGLASIVSWRCWWWSWTALLWPLATGPAAAWAFQHVGNLGASKHALFWGT